MINDWQRQVHGYRRMIEETYQRVQQLENERNTLQERQKQLLRSGLLDSSPAQYGNAQSPLQQSSSFNMRTHDYPYGSLPTPNQPQAI
ncbi:unnamed protein product [Auanema sp. JU1783]|nr:unnamed protein product [Auanema sp. JU1783]